MSTNANALIRREDTAAVQIEMAAAFMPVMQMGQAIQRYNALLSFTQEIMKPGKDYGTIPGVDKPSLFKPGAEKLCNFFGLTPKFVVVKETEQWDGEEPFFYYWYKCQLWRGSALIAEGDGSCNSRESKYRYRWVSEDLVPPHLTKSRLLFRPGRATEPDFAIEKSETSGKYGKPVEYWQAFKDAIAAKTAVAGTKKSSTGREMRTWTIEQPVYRIPNPDIPDQVNTIQKMSQKRALVAVTLIGCNASEYFTQDIEDMQAIDVPYNVIREEAARIDTGGHPVGTQAAADHVARQKIQNGRAPRNPAASAPPDFGDVPIGEPPSTDEPEPPEVQQGARILSVEEFRGAGKKGQIEAFGVLKSAIGDADYYRILGVCGCEHANQFRTLGEAANAYKEMLDTYRFAASQRPV